MEGAPNHFSNAVKRGTKKPNGMALELVYRAKNRCKSSGALAGAFRPPGPSWAGNRPKIVDFRSYPPRNSVYTNPSDCIGDFGNECGGPLETTFFVHQLKTQEQG